MRYPVSFAALMLAIVSPPQFALGALPSAAEVFKETGVTAGLAVVAGSVDGQLEAELTNGGRMLVQGLALSEEAVAKARAHLFEKQLYGLASVARVRGVEALPFYDRLVNLLIADLDALGKAAPKPTEIERVLGYEGVAYLKKGGKWTKTVLATPKEVDPTWGHYAYDATGNPVSKDLVLGPPNTFRWTDGPFGANLVGGFRTANGVAVQINPSYLVKLGRPKIRPELDGLHFWARDVNSGVLLWHRPIVPVGARLNYSGPHTQAFVAAEGRVLAYDFTDSDQVALTAWDIKSGEVLRVFDQGVVLRKADWPGGSAKGADWRKWAHDMVAWSMVLACDNRVVQMFRDKLFVFDAQSGKVLWSKQAGDGTHFLKVLVCGGRAVALRAKIDYATLKGRRLDLVAAEAWKWSDGSPLWQSDLTALVYPSAHEQTYHMNFAAQEPYLLIPLEGKALLLDARDGKRLWEKPSRGRFGHHIIKDRIFMDYAGSTPFGGVLMLETGDHDPTVRDGGTNQSACDAATATLKWFIGKRNFVPVDPAPDTCQWLSLRCMGKKCGERGAASYGSLFGVSPACGCDQFIRGSCAFYAVVPIQADPDNARLTPGGGKPLGPTTSQQLAKKSLTATFWGKPPGLESYWFTTNFRWSEPIHHWPGYGELETPPVTAGDLTLTAHVHEHRLCATRGGEEAWNFIAGGRIGAPPVVQGDLAIFGCHDGCVYAVRLKDGSEAWRLLAAPADRRHMMLGQVESVWPVFNVILHEGKLYCSAGRHEEMDGGVHFYGLDPQTGKIQWHVNRRRGLESNLEPIRQRKNYHGQRGEIPGVLSDGRAQMNDLLELVDGKLCLHKVPMVDIADPKDDVKYPQTLVPPQVGKTSTQQP